jgi:hypothetical protein
MRSKTLVVAVGALLVVTMTATALAGHITGDVKSYTGCLVPKDGVVVKVKEGSAPASPCTGGQTQVHLSGGDITRISGGPGVTVSPASSATQSGHVMINLDPKYSLPQGCDEGEVAKWDDSGWVCATDDNTTYTADGMTLNLSGTQFSIDPDYRVKNTDDCSTGQFATGFEDSGAIKCAAVPPTSPPAFFASAGNVTIGGPTVVITKTLRAGAYLLFANVEIKNKDADSTSSMDYCSIPGYTTTEPIKVEEGSSQIVSFMSAVNHPGGAVVLTCDEFIADVDIASATLSALEVSSLG